MTDDTKSFFQSKTFWGGIIGLAAGGAAIAGYSVSPADQAQIAELITGVVGMVGSALAIYGRIVASKKINWAKKADEDKQGASR